MLDAGLSALEQLLTFEVLGFLLVGVAVGLTVGLLPGLGGSSGMALLLPFLFGMDPAAGIAMLIGMAALQRKSPITRIGRVAETEGDKRGDRSRPA